MAWTGLTLTVDGRNALNQAQMNNRLCFKAIVIGDGNPPGNFGTQKSLVHPLYELTDLKVDMTDEGCALTADFPAVDADYYFREIGVIVATEDGDKLYVYDNCGDDAQYIVSTTGAERTQKRIRLYLTISDVADVAVSAPAILYVDYDEYENAVTSLEQTIGTKAGQAETESALAGKLDKTGDAKDTTVTFASADVADGGAGAWTSVGKLSTGEKLGSAFNKVSMMFKNIRYLYKMLGTTNISAIGGGTVTGAISKLNTDLGGKQNAATAINTSNIGSQRVNYATSSGTATKATQDGNGRNIVNTYLPKSDTGVYYGASLTTAKSIPNDVEIEILTVTAAVTGIYMILGQVNFVSNKTGLRYILFKNNAADGSFGGVQVGASQSGKTQVQAFGVGAYAIGAGEKVRLYAKQNSGAALNVSTAYMSLVRLK